MRILVGPFNRVEGDLEVALEVVDGRVQSARVNATLYRGFEQILQGREPMDALVIAPRICGICSVSQSAAAAQALADLMGAAMPGNGRLAANLIHACENVADHLSHFYLFFMPDFARECYGTRPWFDEAQRRFRAVGGESQRAFLPARANFLHLLGYLAGKWPHTLAIQPGGTSRAIEAAEKMRLYAILKEFRNHLEKHLFGDTLESIAALDSQAALEAWMAGRAPHASDFRLFLEAAAERGLDKLGRATDRFMSFGAYPQENGRWFPAGVWHHGPAALDAAAISEDITHTWATGPDQALAPAEGVTMPDADKAGAYSWCKAPRLSGQVVETGALARQLIAGHPLIRDLVTHSGGNVRNRVIARLLEAARVLPEMEQWALALQPGQPFFQPTAMPEEGRGMGLVEAARGSLGHWLQVRNGRILNYQIVAPTTWNFSPRDGHDQPGALEQALVGTPVEPGEDTPVAVQHVVRSFDPCMVCTVH